MYKMAYVKKSVHKVAPRRRYKKKANAKSGKTFAKRVLAIVSRKVENKQAFLGTTNVGFNSGINSSGDVVRLIPNISQGTADNARIGDVINVKSCRVNILLKMPVVTDYNNASNRVIVARVMIVQPKTYPTYTMASNNIGIWSSCLLKKGGTTSAFTGILEDLYAPINTDVLTVKYDKLVTMSLTYLQNATLVGSVGCDLSKSYKHLNINLKLPKVLKYDAGIQSGIEPVNAGPVLLIGYCHMDGSSPDTVTTQVNMMYDSVLTYEDA